MMRLQARRLLSTGSLLTVLAAFGCADSPFAPDSSSTSTTGGATGATGSSGTNGTPAAPAGSPSSAFNITVRYVGSDATLRQKQAVEAAVARWESVIASDLPDISGSAEANTCFDGQPALDERIDDIVIYVAFAPIDGAGKILGEAGPCFIRNEGMLPLLGHLELDQADLLTMERAGTLDAVVLHEMGHILGIGTLWPMQQLLSGGGGTDPRFTGAQAVSAYHALGGFDAAVPVEDVGADGTRDGHWRETVFGNELMTGYISGSTNPLSVMTIASLRDMGYNANTSLGGTYSFASSTQRVTATDGIRIDGAEHMVTPKFLVDRNGGRTAITGQVSTTPWHK